MKAFIPTLPPKVVLETSGYSARPAFPHKSQVRRAASTFSFRVRRFPVLFFEVYLLASIFVFAFGPVDYDIYNPIALYGFVLAGQVIIFVGYLLGTAQRPCGYRGRIPIAAVVKVAILATIAVLPVTLLYRNYADLSLAEALRDPGAAYAARLESFNGESNSPFFTFIRVALAPLIGMFLPAGIVYWRRLTTSWRALWYVGLAGLVGEFVLSGAAVRLFDMVLTIPWCLWLRLQHHDADRSKALIRAAAKLQKSPTFLRYRASGRGLFIVVSIALLVVGIKYFSYSRQSRYGLSANEYPPFTTGWSIERYGVPLPVSTEYCLYMITRYWTQGYVGLADCLEMRFEWSFGCGHSAFWSRCVSKILACDPNDLDERTYPARLEAITGYPASNNWHTIYPWLASDLTFLGALLFIGGMAFLLARAWSDALVGANPFAIGFLMQILMLFFYLPANNGRLSYAEETVTFWALLLFWLVTRQPGRSK